MVPPTPPAAPAVVAVGVFGVGLIGKALLKQLAAQAEFLQQQLHVQPVVVAVSNSRRMHLASTGIQHQPDWQAALEAGSSADPAALAAHVAAHEGAVSRVLIDCTASASLPDLYPQWLASGLHVITPNKQAGAGPLPRFRALRAAQQQPGAGCFLGEATVGAGLPVLSTLRSLLETGDRVLAIEGVLSGTLSFLFNSLAPGTAFSSVVAAAKAAGYTEPDPREDLSGADVARKVVILGRECGLDLTMAGLEVSSLVPPPLRAPAMDADEFMQQLPQYDADMAAQADAAAKAGEVLRYVGRVDLASGSASVRVARVPASHPFAGLRGADNIVTFVTERYPAATPLVVRGPGAGADVTAAGVFGDLLAVMRATAGARL